MEMKTPLPVQIEDWIKVVVNKRSPNTAKEIAMLHLKNVRAIIDEASIVGNKKETSFPRRNTRR